MLFMSDTGGGVSRVDATSYGIKVTQLYLCPCASTVFDVIYIRELLMMFPSHGSSTFDIAVSRSALRHVMAMMATNTMPSLV